MTQQNLRLIDDDVLQREVEKREAAKGANDNETRDPAAKKRKGRK